MTKYRVDRVDHIDRVGLAASTA